MNERNNDWVQSNNQEQSHFLARTIKKLSPNIKGMDDFMEGKFHNDNLHIFIISALKQLEKNERFDVIKKIKARWSTEKNRLKTKKNFVTHSIKLSADASTELKKMTIRANLKSLHETVESLINRQYKQITDEIKEENKRRKEELVNKKKAKDEAFIKQEYSKKHNSHYVDKLQHNKLQNELNEANQSISHLKSKLNTQGSIIDKYLEKISKFVDKLDRIENTNPPLEESLVKSPTIQDSSSIIENKQEQEQEQENSEDTWKPFTPRKNKNTNKN
jgi:DNA repair exonuclease SbcCD ATPase subunit